eukprot:325056_1
MVPQCMAIIMNLFPQYPVLCLTHCAKLVPSLRTMQSILKKVSFAASSRTDKGVHAAAATFALKLINLFEDPQTEAILNPKQKKKNKDTDKKQNDTDNSALIEQKCEYSQWNEMRDLINKSLPDDIRIHGIQRTTKNFDPRYKAWSRVYHYLLPTYLLDASIKATDITGLEDMFCEYIMHKKKQRNKEMDAQMKEEVCTKKASVEKDVRFGYRMSEDLLGKLKELCQIYVGTRNYHNFTRRTHPKEDRAKRFIYSMEIVNNSLIMDGMEYVQFEIHGTSFLYHQIRKMIGLLVILMRNAKYEFRNTKNKEDVKALGDMVFSVDYKVAIPLAPSQGLYLKSVQFTEYNKKCVKDKQEWKQLKLERYDEGVNRFIMEKILPSITKHEVNEHKLKGNQFGFWLYGLENDFKYEIVEITKELKKQLKEKGIEFVNAGETHEPIESFYDRIINRSKQSKIKTEAETS